MPSHEPTTRFSLVRLILTIRLWVAHRLHLRKHDERGEVTIEVVVVAAMTAAVMLVGTVWIVVAAPKPDSAWGAARIALIPVGGVLAVLALIVATMLSAEAVQRVRERRKCTHADERGVATLWVVLLATAMLAVAGLVIDGGYALGAKREALNQAEQAARIGADALDEGSLRSSGPTVRVDPGRAVAAAQAYLSQVGARGTVTVNDDEVTVTVRARQDTTVLSAVGVGSLAVEATATALSINEDAG